MKGQSMNRHIDLYRTNDVRKWTMIPPAPDREPDRRAISVRAHEPDFALDRIYFTGDEVPWTPAQVALAAKVGGFGLSADPTIEDNGGRRARWGDAGGAAKPPPTKTRKRKK
jgi:hypothetical protein